MIEEIIRRAEVRQVDGHAAGQLSAVVGVGDAIQEKGVTVFFPGDDYWRLVAELRSREEFGARVQALDALISTLAGMTPEAMADAFALYSVGTTN